MSDSNRGDYNTGHWNTGDFNTGYWNTGDWNTGNFNTGNFNTGDRNTGRRNTGHWNTGDFNTGYWNTGDWNTGNFNTGNFNTGHWNAGNWNTGHWNAGNYHTGCFNTVDANKAFYFNTLIDKEVWDNAYKPTWLFEPSPTTWITNDDMTKQEKADNPSYETTGGYLRVNNMKEEWRKAYQSASPEDVQAVRDLPAFDYDVFEERTGLNLRETPKAETCEGREVEIDGVTYVLKLKGEDQ
jgi:hypothetical protein